MITKDLITIFSADTFLVGIKSDSNVSNSEEPSMYKIKSPEYNPCGPFPPTAYGGGNIEIGEILAKQSFS